MDGGGSKVVEGGHVTIYSSDGSVLKEYDASLEDAAGEKDEGEQEDEDRRGGSYVEKRAEENYDADEEKRDDAEREADDGGDRGEDEEREADEDEKREADEDSESDAGEVRRVRADRVDGDR